MDNLKRIPVKILVAAFIVFVSTQAYAAQYAHHVSQKGMDFDWTVNGENLDIQIRAKTQGWVGIGFNPTHDMADANIVIGYVKDGKPEVRDDFGISRTQHKPDNKIGGKDDVKNVSGTEENGVTTLSFTIPINSGDPKDRPIDVNGDTTVIMAHGPDRDSFSTKHSQRVMFDVNLSTGKMP